MVWSLRSDDCRPGDCGDLPVVREGCASAMRRADPRTYVNASTPPMFLLHGTADKTAPPQEMTEMEEALHRVNVRVKTLWLKGRTRMAGSYAQGYARCEPEGVERNNCVLRFGRQAGQKIASWPNCLCRLLLQPDVTKALLVGNPAFVPRDVSACRGNARRVVKDDR